MKILNKYSISFFEINISLEDSIEVNCQAELNADFNAIANQCSSTTVSANDTTDQTDTVEDVLDNVSHWKTTSSFLAILISVPLKESKCAVCWTNTETKADNSPEC